MLCKHLIKAWQATKVMLPLMIEGKITTYWFPCCFFLFRFIHLFVRWLFWNVFMNCKKKSSTSHHLALSALQSGCKATRSANQAGKNESDANQCGPLHLLIWQRLFSVNDAVLLLTGMYATYTSCLSDNEKFNTEHLTLKFCCNLKVTYCFPLLKCIYWFIWDIYSSQGRAES